MSCFDRPSFSFPGGAVEKSGALAFDAVRRLIRRSVPTLVYAMAAESADAFWGAARVGIGAYWELRRLYAKNVGNGEELVPVNLPTLNHPLFLRPGTTDAPEVVHNCVREAYRVLVPVEPVRVIVDAGASIGDTTAWYLSNFPNATVIALEPAPDNYAILVKNCGPYGARAVPLNAALWHCSTTLAFCGSEMADAHSVREVSSSRDATCQAVSVSTLLEILNADSIDIFKCDIEGAEVDVFTDHCDDWLPRVRSILIETHSPHAYTSVRATCARHGFRHSTYRELQVFWR